MSTPEADHRAANDVLAGLVSWVAARIHSEPEARWIVAHAAGIRPGHLIAALDHPVSADTERVVRDLTERRHAGEPLQYVLGEWSFRHLEVTVDPRALVPRPETEQVAEAALVELRRLVSETRSHGADPLVAVDLGTGSGVIALSLALEGVGTTKPGAAAPGAPPSPDMDIEIWATDASVSALDVARANLARLGASQPAAAARVQLAEGSWFDALPSRLAGHVHLVVSNPPYVSAGEWRDLDPGVRDYEPRDALVPGPTGFEALEVLVDQARAWLVPRGGLVLEIAPHQAGRTISLAERAGYVDVGVRPDLAGKDRILVARWPGT